MTKNCLRENYYFSFILIKGSRLNSKPSVTGRHLVYLSPSLISPFPKRQPSDPNLRVEEYKVITPERL